jgi:hypothetical protein
MHLTQTEITDQKPCFPSHLGPSSSPSLLAGGDVAAGGCCGGGRGPAARQGGGGGLGQSIAGVVRMAVFWYFAAKFFGPKRPPAEPAMLMSNLFQKGEPMVRTPSDLVTGRRPRFWVEYAS